jgi:hypothetical protein
MAATASDGVARALRAFCGRSDGEYDSAKEMDATPLALVLETRRQQQRRANTKKRTKAKQQTRDAPVDDDKDDVAVASIDEQIRALPRKLLHAFCDATLAFADAHLREDAPPLSAEELLVIDVAAQFARILVTDEQQITTIDQGRVIALAQQFHDRLLRLRGDPASVEAAQDAIAALCEGVWTARYSSDCKSVITQLLPYLIVRAYESQPSDAFQSKRHPIRRLYAVRDALLELDFQDESSGYALTFSTEKLLQEKGH